MLNFFPTIPQFHFDENIILSGNKKDDEFFVKC